MHAAGLEQEEPQLRTDATGPCSRAPRPHLPWSSSARSAPPPSARAQATARRAAARGPLLADPDAEDERRPALRQGRRAVPPGLGGDHPRQPRRPARPRATGPEERGRRDPAPRRRTSSGSSRSTTSTSQAFPTAPGVRTPATPQRLTKGRKPVMYAHVVQEAGRPGIALQYWFYYWFNRFNDLHESDWEMIQLAFDGATTPEEALARSGPDANRARAARRRRDGRLGRLEGREGRERTRSSTWPRGRTRASTSPRFTSAAAGRERGSAATTRASPRTRGPPHADRRPDDPVRDQRARLAAVPRPLGPAGEGVLQRRHRSEPEGAVGPAVHVDGEPPRLDPEDAGLAGRGRDRDQLLLRSDHLRRRRRELRRQPDVARRAHVHRAARADRDPHLADPLAPGDRRAAPPGARGGPAAPGGRGDLRTICPDAAGARPRGRGVRVRGHPPHAVPRRTHRRRLQPQPRRARDRQPERGVVPGARIPARAPVHRRPVRGGDATHRSRRAGGPLDRASRGDPAHSATAARGRARVRRDRPADRERDRDSLRDQEGGRLDVRRPGDRVRRARAARGTALEIALATVPLRAQSGPPGAGRELAQRARALVGRRRPSTSRCSSSARSSGR